MKTRIYAAPAVKGLKLPTSQVGDRGFVHARPRLLVKIQ